MPRSSTSGLSDIFVHKKKVVVFQPESLVTTDESNGFETYQTEEEPKTVGVRIMTLDGENEILVPAEQLEGLRYIVNAALRANLTEEPVKRKRRTKEEIEAEKVAVANGTYGVPAGQNPVSNNVMVNLMDSNEAEKPDEPDDDDSDTFGDSDASESNELELAAAGTAKRSRRR